MKSKLIDIARYLKTRTEGKKHGGYLIYEDDKIKISYDTYYPNLDVHVLIDGDWQRAAIYSGHGDTQEFHPGAWTGYVENVLHPKAQEAKKLAQQAQREREAQRLYERNCPLDDSAVFQECKG